MLFLSYARSDVAKVDEVFADLDRANRDPWRDLEMTGGSRWWDEILERIRSCDVFLFLLSADSVRSRACRAELAYADALGVPIVPVMVRQMELDMAPEQIAEMVVVDVRTRSAESTIELLNAIDSVERRFATPDPLPEPPPVPLNELAPIADRLAEPSLSLDAQRSLVAELSSFADIVEHQAKVAELARELGSRPDLAAAVRPDVDRLIGQIAPGSVGDESVDAEELAQRADRVRSVLTYLRRSTFTPILGHGLTDSLIAPRREIAQDWAETLDFPLSGPDRTNLAQVAQFVSVMNDPETLRELLRSYLIDRLGGNEQGADALNSQLADLVRTAWREREARHEIDAQRVLAALDCPIYVNANPWGLLTEALEDAGKDPQVEVCRWRPDVYDWPESVFERDPSYRPTVDRPLVYHVFGALSVPESTVITEDDYLDFMSVVTADRALVPLPVQNALADSSLLLLGFDLTELDTRVLLRTLVSQEGGRLHKYSHVAAQVDPESSAISPARAKQYLERYFGRGREPAMDLYWGSVDDFVRDIAAAGAAGGGGMTAHEDANPYVGPRAISYGEPIYGRDHEIDDLTSTLVSQRIVLLYSPSGAGKSSLVDAGVRPRLEDRGFHVLPTIRVGHVVGADTTNRYLTSAKLSLSEAVPADQRWDQERLADVSFEDHLDRVLSVTADPERDPCLVFDQFEELFTLDPADWDEKEAFLTELGVALRNRSRWALFSMREDYIAQLDPLLSLLPTRLSTRFRLDLLEPKAARMATVRPADDAGVEFTDAAADQLIEDLRETQVSRAGETTTVPGRYVEPVVLQAVCRRLWEQSAPHERIDVADVEALGDVDDALADFCDDRFAQAAVASGASEQRIRDWVEERLITDQGFRSQTASGPAGTGDAVLRALEDGHLLRAESRRGTTWYEIPHDRLVAPIRSSNRRWLDLHLDPVQTAARTWDEHGRSVDLLLRGTVLENAERWLVEHPGEVAQVDREFVEAGRAAQRQLDDERRRNQRDRRQRTLVAALAVLSVGLGGVVVYFVNEDRLEKAAAAEEAEAEAAAAGAAESVAAEAAAAAEAAGAVIASAEGSSTKAVIETADAAEEAQQAALLAAEEATDEATRAAAEELAAEAEMAAAVADATRQAVEDGLDATAEAAEAAMAAAEAAAAEAAAEDDVRAQLEAQQAADEAAAVQARVAAESAALEESLNWSGEYEPEPASGLEVRLGDSGNTIGWLQHELRARGLTLDADCYFGRDTETAVKDVQSVRALAVTGLADNQLWQELGVDVDPPDRPVTCKALGDDVADDVCRTAVPVSGLRLVVRNVAADDSGGGPISAVEEVLGRMLAATDGDETLSTGECTRRDDADWMRLVNTGGEVLGEAPSTFVFLDREPLQVSSPRPASEDTATTVPAARG